MSANCSRQSKGFTRSLFAAISDAKEIRADSDLIEDLEISSMDILFVVSSLEEAFGIQIPEREIRGMTTVGDVAGIVTALKG